MKDNINRKLSSNRAITLIALIITIIVMLILVAVTVSVVINSNLIGTAKNAGDRTKTAYEQEGSLGKITIGGVEYDGISGYMQSKCNHEFGDWIVVKEPSYTEAGERYKTCAKCNLKQTEYPSMLSCDNHTYGENDWVVETPATCKAKGLKYVLCTTCGTRVEEEIAIDTANGHNFTDGTCTICGATNLPVGAGTRYAQNGEYTDGSRTAIIPAGFTVSGVPGESTIDGGLVIYLIPEGTTVDWTDATAVANAQKTYDQFVWIPIKNTTDANAQDINDMYICQGKTADNGVCTITVENGVAKCTNPNHSAIVDDTLPEAEQINKNALMAGRLYANSTGEKFEQAYTETYTSGSGLREPDVVVGTGAQYDGASTTTEGVTTYTYLSTIQTILNDNTNYADVTKWKNALQKEYDEVVKSVYENQGFYVGRYETSGMAQSETSYDVAVVAETLPSVEIDWYHMYAQQKNYAKANSLTVGSTMIQGAAYDQVLKFVNTATYSVTTAGNVGHSFGSRYNTGSQSTDQSKNIFDLEGNVRAWTTEASNTNLRVFRGGIYYDSFSASSRGNDYPLISGRDYVGSLCQLYVK